MNGAPKVSVSFYIWATRHWLIFMNGPPAYKGETLDVNDAVALLDAIADMKGRPLP
jgi:hypothetical protein